MEQITNEMPTSVSTIDDIKNEFAPIVELPGWDPAKPFFARVGQISMMNLINQGAIPNELLNEAHEIVEKGKNPITTAKSPEDLEKFISLLITVARASLIEPTYEQLEEAGVRLTDQQLSWIYVLSQRGIRAMRKFRELPGDGEAPGGDGESVEQGTE